jgi:hypothetical protein
MGDKVRRTYPAPVKCRATSKRTGRRCGRWAVPGNVVCINHGAMGGPIGGRPAAEELHAVRRIEALVGDQVQRRMAAEGWSPALLETISDAPPSVRPHNGPSADLITDEDAEAALTRSMRRMAEELTRRFQGAALGLASAEARPPTIPGEVVEAEPVPVALPAAAPDPVAEDIALLEARPTSKRTAEAARLRRLRERDAHSLTHHSHAGDPEPEATPADPAPDPAPDPRPAKPRRTTTTLGLQAGDLR